MPSQMIKQVVGTRQQEKVGACNMAVDWNFLKDPLFFYNPGYVRSTPYSVPRSFLKTLKRQDLEQTWLGLARIIIQSKSYHPISQLCFSRLCRVLTDRLLFIGNKTRWFPGHSTTTVTEHRITRLQEIT